jgi:hypothetical protein
VVNLKEKIEKSTSASKRGRVKVLGTKRDMIALATYNRIRVNYLIQ